MEEFNFEASNQRFNKEQVLSEIAPVAEEKTKSTAYNKNSFFDNLTSDNSGPKDFKKIAADERRLNTETFGQTSVFHGHRGHHRGGYRGGHSQRGYHQKKPHQSGQQSQGQQTQSTTVTSENGTSKNFAHSKSNPPKRGTKMFRPVSSEQQPK